MWSARLSGVSRIDWCRVPFFCFSRIIAATASLSRCISLPDLVFFDFCKRDKEDVG